MEQVLQTLPPHRKEGHRIVYHMPQWRLEERLDLRSMDTSRGKLKRGVPLVSAAVCLHLLTQEH